MPEWLAEAVARLAAAPLLQATLAALATLVLEDPATIGCGLLVADRKMGYLTALGGLFVGIALGDIGLYGLGRWCGPRVARWGWVGAERLERSATWFRRRMTAAVLLSRFVPGMRLPTYLAAGVLRAPFGRFLILVLVASLVWTWLLLTFTVAVGAAILPWLGRARWPLAGLAIALFVVVQRRVGRRLEAETQGADRRAVSPFETWPPWLFYLPVAIHYAWLALRHRSVMLPTAANPSIFSGGLLGESKSAILELVPSSHRRWLAPWVVLDCSAALSQEERHARARQLLARAAIDYPIVAKPDVGQRGAGVRPLDDDAGLVRYLAEFPAGHRLVLQAMAFGASGAHGGGDERVHEAGVLYWRRPESERGSIFSITLKQIPVIRGDGRSTVRELIRGDERARRFEAVYLARHASIADRVLAPGDELPLVFAGNHCQGAIFRDGTHLATPALLDRIDEIARAMPEFYFGRFDIRFDRLDAFLEGAELLIIEINGAGAEATHIWDASTRLSDAYRTLFQQFRLLFSIGAANRRRGFRPMGVARFLGEVAAYRRAARGYPPTS